MGPEPAAGRVYFPVEGRPWRLSMGLRPLDPALWLEVDDRRAEELRIKWDLLAQPSVRDGVVATTPGSEMAASELLALVLTHMDTHHPGLVDDDVGGVLLETTTGRRVDPAVLHPIDSAGRLVQEDLCLMSPGTDGWVLTAASVCFPSRWTLGLKIGRTIDAIHAPVPGYGDSLSTPVNRFFDRIGVDRPVYRFNWTLLDTPVLSLPDPEMRRAVSLAEGDLGQHLWFRVERQTLRRLEGCGDVVFTIRTYVTRLDELVSDQPAVVEAFLAALASVPEATVEYKGWTTLLPGLLEWLQDRLAAGPIP